MFVEKNILLFCLFLITFSNFDFSNASSNLTEFKASDCNRKCTTGYSDSICWGESFDFFSKDMVNSMVDYLDLARVIAKNDAMNSSELLEQLIIYESGIIDEFMEELKEEADDDIKNITQQLKEIFDFIHIQFNESVQFNSQKDMLDLRKCPDGFECFEERRKVLNNYKLFTFLISGITAAVVLFYIITYIIVEEKFVKKFKYN